MNSWRLAVAIIGASVSGVSSPDEMEIRPGTKVDFAAASECARVLSSRDAFVQAMSPFDRSARLKTDKNVTEAEYLAFAASQARDWTQEETLRLKTILESFRVKTMRLNLRFPPHISLLKTTGLEEGMAAYCRGTSIVIPAKLIGQTQAQLEALIFHELFHIYRAHTPETRRALYRIIGFDVCPEIALPPGLRSRKITNPDAPLLDSYIRIRIDGRRVAATPVLFARTERYDTRLGGEFFNYMMFRLLVLDETSRGFTPSMPHGEEARLLDPEEVPDYLDQVGRNTKYIIHPEEILADNFVLTVTNASSVPSPRILREMRSVLTK